MNLSKRYDDLVTRARLLLTTYNPCRWDDIAKDCIRGTSGCCSGCPNLQETGCTITSLACLLWICPSVSATLPEEVINKFKAIWDEAHEHNLLTFRGSREESIKNAKYCSRTKEVRCVCVNKYGDSTWILSR